MKEAMEKVPDGKLLRIKVDYASKINNVQIIGDFFIHPEESITELEKILSKLDIDFDEKEAIQKLKKYTKENNVQLIGLDEEAIIRVMKKAMQE